MRLLLLFLAVAAFGSSSGYAISSSDLFCLEVPLSMPTYYESASKSCDGGKTHVLQAHVCSENVVCGYVSNDIKKDAKDASGNKKAFSELSTKEKSDYLKQSPDFESFPTVLTCASNSGSTTCPAPNDCLGDVLFKARQTDFAQDTHDAIREDRGIGTDDLIQVGQPTGAGTTK